MIPIHPESISTETIISSQCDLFRFFIVTAIPAQTGKLLLVRHKFFAFLQVEDGSAAEKQSGDDAGQGLTGRSFAVVGGVGGADLRLDLHQGDHEAYEEKEEEQVRRPDGSPVFDEFY